MNVAFYADGIIERFDLENLEALSELEVNSLWREISLGLKILSFQKFDRTELVRLSGMKPNNFQNFGKLFNLVSIKNNQEKVKNTENPSKKRRHFDDDMNGPTKKAKVHLKSTEEDRKRIEGQKCKFCPLRYKTKDTLARHYVDRHFLCICPICNKEKRIG